MIPRFLWRSRGLIRRVIGRIRIIELREQIALMDEEPLEISLASYFPRCMSMVFTGLNVLLCTSKKPNCSISAKCCLVP